MIALLGTIWWLLADLAVADAQPATLEPANYGSARYVGYVADNDVTEASGLTFSKIDADRIWLHNDSGHPARLYAATSTGVPLGEISVTGASNVDWEDLASYRHDGQPMLVIGDIGDNGGVRDHISLHFLLEPTTVDRKMDLAPSWTLNIRYPDEPHDCESISIDAEEGYVYLLTKRTKPALLYRVPLEPASSIIEAELVTAVDKIPQPSPELIAAHPRTGRYRAQPTAMDFDPAGRQAAVLTYHDAYIFDRVGSEPWGQAFARAPKVLSLPLLPQGEAIAYNQAGSALYVTSEKWPSPIIRLVRD